VFSLFSSPVKGARVVVGGSAGSLRPQRGGFMRTSPLNSEPYIALADLHAGQLSFCEAVTVMNEVFHLIGNKNKLRVLRERMFFIWLCFLSLFGGRGAQIVSIWSQPSFVKTTQTEINNTIFYDDQSILFFFPRGRVKKNNENEGTTAGIQDKLMFYSYYFLSAHFYKLHAFNRDYYSSVHKYNGDVFTILLIMEVSNKGLWSLTHQNTLNSNEWKPETSTYGQWGFRAF